MRGLSRKQLASQRVRVRVPGLPLGLDSPVALRRRQLAYTQSIDGSSPSRTTRRDASPLGAGHACKTCLVEFESQ